jgi:hypothetical protein
LNCLGDRLHAELRPACGHEPILRRGAGHQRRALGDVDQLLEGLHGVGHVGVAHPPPGLGQVRNDVGLNAPIGDDAVKPIGRTQLLAQIGDADIHQLVGVERVLGVPRVDRGVRGLAVKGEIGADRGVIGEAIAGRHLVADVQIDDGIHILEISGAHDIGPADRLLLGGAERDDDAAGEAVAHHRLLYRKGGGGGETAMGVVPLHVAGRAGHERLAGELHGGLRAFRQRVDLADDGDGRMPAAPARPQIGRHAGGAELDGESAGFEHVLHELGAFEFLHAELGEIVDRIADLRHRHGIALDDPEGEFLLLVARRLARQRHQRAEQ